MGVFTPEEEEVFRQVRSLAGAFGYGVQQLPDNTDSNVDLLEQALRICISKLHLLPANEQEFEERFDSILCALRLLKDRGSGGA